MFAADRDSGSLTLLNDDYSQYTYVRIRRAVDLLRDSLASLPRRSQLAVRAHCSLHLGMNYMRLSESIPMFSHDASPGKIMAFASIRGYLQHLDPFSSIAQPFLPEMSLPCIPQLRAPYSSIRTYPLVPFSTL
jgi:hypothetical protein